MEAIEPEVGFHSVPFDIWICVLKSFGMDELEPALLSFSKTSNYTRQMCRRFIKQSDFKFKDRPTMMAYIASRGYTSLLQYFDEDCGFNWDWRVVTESADNGHLECLQYTYQRSKADIKEICQFAANVECLKYLHENGSHWDFDCASAFACKGRLECLEYAYSNGCDVDADMLYIAAQYNQVECLRFGHEKGLVLHPAILRRAIDKGAMDCVRYIIEHTDLMGPKAVTAACRSGQLECLKYFREKGAPFTAEHCEAASNGEHADCVAYLHAKGCTCEHNEGGTNLA